jgi:hypothetical protein
MLCRKKMSLSEYENMKKETAKREQEVERRAEERRRRHEEKVRQEVHFFIATKMEISEENKFFTKGCHHAPWQVYSHDPVSSKAGLPDGIFSKNPNLGKFSSIL